MENMTKSQMLVFLTKMLPEIHILPIFILKSTDYFRDKKTALDKIRNFFGDDMLIVRSSSVKEDTIQESNAGQYDSIMNVDINSDEFLQQAIEVVYQSYHTNAEEEILLQPMLKHIIKAGVAFTSDLYTNAPYYTINYSESEDSAAVTSGGSKELKTFVAYKKNTSFISDSDMENLISILKRIELFLNITALDIEFGIDDKHDIYIFQVRPIARGRKEVFHQQDLDGPLEKIYKKVEKLLRPHPFLLGDTTCFGVMPDWNPAEILGIRPGKLAVTLYKELVTDNIWAHQRADYGYRDLTLHPLMVSFCGIPYIDTRVTFNSFIPKKLNFNIAEKLVNYYIRRLEKYPIYHDKIEFEIVYSCYYFGLTQDLKILLDYGFNENELKRIEYALLEMTNKIIHPENGLYKKDIKKIDILVDNHQTIMESEISIVDKIYWLIEECKKFGTLPFAGVARAGFIAVQFLRSFVSSGILSNTEYEQFMHSLDTISHQLSRDRKEMENGNLEQKDFLKKYGHIRPGTYDILSPRYDENFEYYFKENSIERGNQCQEVPFHFSQGQLERIDTELTENGLCVTAEQLLCFIRESIEGREYLKFVFTRSVSEILRLIGELGTKVGLKKEDMYHLDISVIKQLYVDLYYDNLYDVLKTNIEMNRKQFECAKLIKLPSVILKPEDVYNFFLLQDEPNFITLKKICADIVTEQEFSDKDVAGKIVIISSADPGYDYLLSKGIGGLVTEFGGANSHMAIRCAELGIPAVIGAGEKNFTEWSNAGRICIDCNNHRVSVE